MRFIGHLNREELFDEFGQLNTSEVVLMDERAVHIQERHPEDWKLFDQYAQSTIENPHFILKDSKNETTVFMIRRIEQSNINIVVRLSVSGQDDKAYKNSIMTFYRIREANLKKLIEKSKTLYIQE